MAHRTQHDGVLVVGAGLAGLSAALAAAPRKALVLTGAPLNHGCSSAWAQGGMAAALSEEDDWALHAADTVAAGAGLVDAERAALLAREGAAAVRTLAALGAPFDRDEAGAFSLSLEAAHSRARVARVRGDQAGRAIMAAVTAATLAQPHIEVRSGARLRGLLQDAEGQVRGVIIEQAGQIHEITAPAVILATGGIGGLYAVTTTPPELRGEGLGLAASAGAMIADPEFVQFHPTAIDIGRDPAPLATEALRGEGALLINGAGEAFMAAYHPAAELAPRDVVARAIDHEMKRLGADCLYLDISHKPADFIIEHFPTVYAKCLQLGLDITRDPMPVVPAAHYTCGGVMINETGQTDLPGLYAIGETSFTGLHGANRMASNSLLECMVYGKASAEHIGATLAGVPEPREHKEWDESQVTDSDEDVVISHNWDELRRFMWDYVGIVRTEKRLQRAQHRVDMLKSEIAEYYSNYHISNDLLELRNLVVIAELIILSAMQRKESRGLHFMRDFPGVNDEAVDTVLTPDLN